MNTQAPGRSEESYVFVCYAHADKVLVDAELTLLSEAGVAYWYDHNIAPGSEWTEAIAEHIQGCKTFVYFITPESVAREHCRRELNFAIDKEKPVVAIHLVDTVVPPALELSLNHRQAILKHRLSAAAYREKVRDALNVSPAAETARPVPEPPKVRTAPRLGVGLMATVAIAAVVVIVTLLLFWFAQPAPPALTPTLFLKPVDSTHRKSDVANQFIEDLAFELSNTSVTVVSSEAAAASFTLVSRFAQRGDQDVADFLLERNADRHVIWSARVPMDDTRETGALARARYVSELVRTAVGVYVDVDPRSHSDRAKEEHLRAVSEFMKIALGTTGSWRTVETHYQAAIGADPEFYPALWGLGMLYKNRMGYTLTWAQSVGPAREYAARSLALDPDHDVFLVANVNRLLDLDYEAAWANYQLAKEQGFLTLGEIESEMAGIRANQGRVEEALELLESAERLGAGTNILGVRLGRAGLLATSDQYERACELAAQVYEAGAGAGGTPEHAVRVSQLVEYCARGGEREMAAASFAREEKRLLEQFPYLFPEALLLLGRKAEAVELLTSIETLAVDALPIRSQVFKAYVELGDLDQAFRWLRHSIENREHDLFPHLYHSQRFASVRADPRYVAEIALLRAIEAEGTPLKTNAYP